MDQSRELSFVVGHLKKLSIPSTSVVDHHVVYHIEVSISDYSWIVKRRYREFCELHEKLAWKFKINQIILPPKKFIGNLNPEHIEKRRVCLEAYLQDIVNQLGKIPRLLQIFLEFDIYDISAVTQTLAERFFQEGGNLLTNKEPFVVTPLQLYCISQRLKLPIPTCGEEGYLHDVGSLYDIVYCVKNLKILGDDNHKLIGLSSEEISFDLSLFKSLKSLEVSNCNIESLQGTYHLKENLQKLVVHSSLNLFKDILIDQEVWTHGTPIDVFTSSNSSQTSVHAMMWQNLTEIDFSHNYIPYIDESVTLLHKLEKFNLSFNEVKEIEHLQDLLNLQELDLSHNQIESLDRLNTKLGNIKVLKIASNKVQCVGDTPKMYSLVELDLSENFIDDVADVMSLADLPCLEVLNLSENPVTKKDMYRTRLLTTFEERVSQIRLDDTVTSPEEVKEVMRILADMNSFELVSLPTNTSSLPAKNKSGPRKTNNRRIKVKNQELLEGLDAGATPTPVIVRKFSEGEQEFKNRVEQIRHLGGDAWLGLMNELQNEYKQPVDPRSVSLPERSHSADQRYAVSALHSSASKIKANGNHPSGSSSAKSSKARQPVMGRSSLQFGFSAELEDLVSEKMKESKDLVNGTFIVSVEITEKKIGDETAVVEEERMICMDLAKGVLMEIAIGNGKTCAKHKLDGVSSVDIFESPDAFYVDLLHTESKQLRRHRDFLSHKCNLTAREDYKHVAKYKMRSMKDAAELFVLLYKFISESLNVRLREQVKPTIKISVENGASTTVGQTGKCTAKLSNPAGISADLFQQFLTNSVLRRRPMEAELTESGRDAVQTEKEEVHAVLWTYCLPYALPDHELPVCLVLTNLNVHLFHLKDHGIHHPLTSPTSLDEVKSRLPFLCSLPLLQLHVVVCGLFDQAFRLEFSELGPYGTFTFLTRDSNETDSFYRVLGEITKTHIALPASTSGAGPTEESSLTVVHPNEERVARLKEDIVKCCSNAFREDECILMYSIVHEVPDMTSIPDKHVTLTSNTRTLIVTNLRLFLCEEDHVHWPLPSYVRDTPSTPQWLVTKHDDIKHIIGIEVFDVADDVLGGVSGMSLLLEINTQDQEDGSCRETKVWNLIFKLEEERQQLQRSLSQIWSDNFHGNLQVTKSRPLNAQKIRHSSRVDVPVEFFQEFPPSASRKSPPESLSTSRSGQGHRRNRSGQFSPSQYDDTFKKSMQILQNAKAESLENFFTEKLRPASAGDDKETIVSYTWTGCVAHCNSTREVHTWLVLSSLKFYVIADWTDRAEIGAIHNVMFGPGTKLSFNWFRLTALRQVCVGLFDQTFRLETDDPEGTFTFITRDYKATSCFLEHLKNTLKECEPEHLSLTADASSAEPPSIYDTSSNNAESDDEQLSEQVFHYPNGVVRFVYPSDDTVELLKHSILEFSKNSECRVEMTDVSILMYLLVFQVVNEKKLPRTFIILDHALCTCLEDHVNYPLPLFVKGLPMGSRYEVENLCPLANVKRIEFTGFNTLDFTIVFEQKCQHRANCKEFAVESVQDTEVSSQDRACPSGEIRWTILVQTYEEKEKALAMILKLWKECYGEELPVLRI